MELDTIQVSRPPEAHNAQQHTDPDAAVPGSIPSEYAKRMRPTDVTYLHGWRLEALTGCILVGLLLANMEVPIVNTAVVSITEDLGDFTRASWIISAYLLGYVGTVIINAKLSDIFGRKFILMTSFFIFLAFSGACGGAQTTTQLIVFRVFKGLGGSGLATVTIIALYDSVPPERLAIRSSNVSLSLALANILGPILGGIISRDSSWRWVFLINVPIGLPFMILCAIVIPPNFPFHGNPNAPTRSIRKLLSSRSTLQRIDCLGAFVLLVATIFFVTAFHEAGKDFAWNSSFIVSFLIVCVFLFFIFTVYEWYISKVSTRRNVLEPVFPWRFVENRTWMGMLIVALFHGVAWVVPIFQIPQRLEVIYGVSPVGGGTRLLPFTTLAPISSIVCALLAKKGIAPIYLLIAMACLQIIGFAGLATLPHSTNILARQYGFEFIAGIGAGPMTVLLPLVVPFAVENRDRGVGMAALTQARMMGGVMRLSIVTTAMNNLVRTRLSDGNLLMPQQLDAVLKTPQLIQTLEPGLQNVVRLALDDGLVGCIMMWKKPQIQIDGSQPARMDSESEIERRNRLGTNI